MKDLCCFLFLISFIACQQTERIDKDKMASLGNRFKNEYQEIIHSSRERLQENPNDLKAKLGLVETNIMLYIFGLEDRDKTMSEAQKVFQQVWELDSTNGDVQRLSAIISFLNWEWEEAGQSFIKAIQTDPDNPSTRHWFSLYLSAMGDMETALMHSDTIMTLDTGGDYQIGRGSLFYFSRQNERLKDLMIEVIEGDPNTPWAYDWLGMAYCELEDFESSIHTYFKAFELSDGLAEVGAGLGHALGLGGKIDMAKQLANYYSEVSSTRYVPSVQRAFIHIGLGEYDEAIALLEKAYQEKSWFIIFIQIEPWYDPIRDDSRFQRIINKMKFPT